MIDEQLRIDTEYPIQQLLIIILTGLPERASGNVTHRVESLFLEASRVAPTDPPEIRDRPVFPKLPPVAHLIELSNADSVLVSRHMFCDYIHRDLAQIEISPDTRSRSDSCLLQDLPNHGHGQLMRCHLVSLQIGRRVNEDFIDGINMHIFRCDVLEIDIINLSAALDIVGHARSGNHIIDSQRRICLKLIVIHRLS